MRSLVTTLLLAGVMAAVAVALSPPGTAEEDAKKQIALVGASYRAAFEAGDAAALAGLFAAAAEYVAEDGAAWQGRDAIEKLAKAFFTRVPGAKVSATEKQFRLLGPSAAVAEGVVTVTDGSGRVCAHTRYTFQFTKEGERWVIASLRESPLRKGDLSPRERLQTVAWLVGDWMDDSEQARIRATCRWSEDGPWLIQTFRVTDRAGAVTRYTQRIGWDAFLGKIRSWSWDSDGGHGGAVWTPTEDGWLLQSRGISGKGAVGVATYLITKETDDIYRWDSTQVVVGNAVAKKVSHTIVRMPPEVMR